MVEVPEEKMISKLGLDISDIPRQIQALGGLLNQATSIIKKFNGNADNATSATIRGIDELGRSFTKTVTTLANGSEKVSVSIREMANQTQTVTAEMKKFSNLKELEKVASQIEKIRVKMASLDAQGKNKNYYDALNDSLTKLVQRQATLTSAIKRSSSFTADDQKRLTAIKEIAKAEEKVTIEKAKQQDKKLAEDERKRAEQAKENARQQQEIQRIQEQQRQIVDQIYKRMIQMVALRALRQMWQEAVKYATEYYDALNEIRLVTGMSQDEANQLGQQYRELAEDMRVTSTSLITSVTSLYRQGLSDNEVYGRLKQITEFATVAGIEVEEATRLMTSSINNFIEEGEDGGQAAQRIADTYANFGDRVATDAESIATAMTKTAASASNVGMSLERTAAYASTILAVTQDEAESVGNALNTIISRYSRITKTGFGRSFEFDGETVNVNDVAQALSEAAGINVFDYDAGQFRDFGEVLDELAAKWGSLTERERNYIATQLAGTRQYNRVLTLMQNYDMAMELLESSYTDTGTVAQKYAVWTESVAAAQNNLKNSLEELYSVLSGEVLKDFYNGLAGIVDLFASGLKAMDGWPIKIAGIAAALGGVVLVVMKMIEAWKALQVVIGAVQYAMGMISAGGGIAGAMGVAGGALSMGPIITGVVALAGAITMLVGAFAQMGNASREAYTATVEESQALNGTLRTLKGYRDSVDAADFGNGGADELKKVRNAIVDTYPEIARIYQIERNDVDTLAVSYENLAEQTRKALRAIELQEIRSAYLAAAENAGTANRDLGYWLTTNDQVGSSYHARTAYGQYNSNLASIDKLRRQQNTYNYINNPSLYRADIGTEGISTFWSYDAAMQQIAEAEAANEKILADAQQHFEEARETVIRQLLGYSSDMDTDLYNAKYNYLMSLLSFDDFWGDGKYASADPSGKMREVITASLGEMGDDGVISWYADELDAQSQEIANAADDFSDSVGESTDTVANTLDALNEAIGKITEKRDATTAAANGYAEQLAGALDAIASAVEGVDADLDGESVFERLLGFKDMPRMMGNVDLMSRKTIDSFKLLLAGWEDVEAGIATLFSQTYSAGRGGWDNGFDWELDRDVVLNVTPILPDGTVLTPEELESYLGEIIGTANSLGGNTMENILGIDANNLGVVLSVEQVVGSLESAYESAGEAMENLHNQQEAFYASQVDPGKVAVALGEYFAGIMETNETLAKAMLEEYPAIAELVFAGDAATMEQLQAALEEWEGRIDDATQSIIDGYNRSQAAQGGYLDVAKQFGFDWAVNGFDAAWESLGEQGKKLGVDLQTELAKVYPILQKIVAGAEDATDAMWDFNAAVQVQNLKNLEETNEVMDGTGDAIENAAKSAVEFAGSEQKLTGEAKKLADAQQALYVLQNKTNFGIEEQQAAMDTLASYTGYSADQLRNNLAPAEEYIAVKSTEVSGTVQGLINYLATIGAVNLGAGNITQQLEAIAAGAYSTASAVAGLALELQNIGGSATNAVNTKGRADKANSKTGGTTVRSGGGGGGGGGGRSRSKTSYADRIISSMTDSLEISDHARELAQQAQAYYEVRRELQGVIRYMEVERRLVEDENKTLEGYLKNLEDAMVKYAGNADELAKLQAQHQEYSLRLLKNKTDVENLTKSIKAQNDAIRKMEIELRNTILQAIEDREAREERMLQGRVKMENEMIALLKKRYEKERDEILETAELREKTLEDEKNAIDELLEARKKQEESEDRLQKIAELEAKITRISADPTRQKEAASLREELAKLRNDLAWEEAETEAEAQKKALDDQIQNIEDYKTYVEEYYEELLNNPRRLMEELTAIIESSDEAIIAWLKENSEDFAKATDATQQTMIEGWQATLLDMRGAIEVYWEEVESIIARGDDYIIQFLKEHSAAYAEAGKLQAEAYVDEWMDQLEALHLAYKVIEGDINPYSYSSTTTTTSSSGGGGGGGGGGGSGSGNSISAASVANTKNAISSVRDKLGAAKTPTNTLNSYRKSDILVGTHLGKKTISMYASGGLNDYTGLAMLHGTPQEPEAVLNPQQTKLFQQFVAVMTQIPKVNVPLFGGVDTSGFAGGGGIVVNGMDIKIDVNSLDNDTDIEDAADKLGNAFLKRIQRGMSVGGVRFGNR